RVLERPRGDQHPCPGRSALPGGGLRPCDRRSAPRREGGGDRVHRPFREPLGPEARGNDPNPGHDDLERPGRLHAGGRCLDDRCPRPTRRRARVRVVPDQRAGSDSAPAGAPTRHRARGPRGSGPPLAAAGWPGGLAAAVSPTAGACVGRSPRAFAPGGRAASRLDGPCSGRPGGRGRDCGAGHRLALGGGGRQSRRDAGPEPYRRQRCIGRARKADLPGELCDLPRCGRIGRWSPGRRNASGSGCHRSIRLSHERSGAAVPGDERAGRHEDAILCDETVRERALGPGELPAHQMAFGPMIRALRSAARGPAVISALAATALTGLVSQPVLAHAVGKPFQSPIPLWMQLAGAGIAVAASFVVSAAIVTVGTDEPRYPHLAIPLLPSLVVQWLLAAIGLLWWYGAIVAAFLIGGETPVPAIGLWIFVWVGLPIASVLLGNPWPSLSPFRTSFTLLERFARFVGFDRLDLGLVYPLRAARWPA